jgi:hypothetical protein
VAAPVLKAEHGMLVVTETRDFAGKQMTVTRTLAADSKEAKALQRKAASSSATGIDAVLQQIEKRRKVCTSRGSCVSLGHSVPARSTGGTRALGLQPTQTLRRTMMTTIEALLLLSQQ